MSEWVELPDYVEFVGGGINEYQCQRCPGAWDGRNREKAATHDCADHQLRGTEAQTDDDSPNSDEDTEGL